MKAESSGTGQQTMLNVYQADGSAIYNLSFVGCAQNGSQVQFTAQAGVTYYIQGGNLYGGAGELHVSLERVPGVQACCSPAAQTQPRCRATRQRARRLACAG